MSWDKFKLSASPVKMTASGLIYAGPCVFHGYLVGTDGVNDPSVTIYNNTKASGREVAPSATYDASALGMNGVTGMYMYCDLGLYLDVSCAGAVEVIVGYAPWEAG